MHSGYPIMMQSISAPGLINVEEAYKSGLWGAIHELGHNQQRRVWEFPPHTTQCTCNLWSVYVHEEVLRMNRANAHPNMTLENRQARTKMYCNGGKDLNSWSMWTALETYMQVLTAIKVLTVCLFIQLNAWVYKKCLIMYIFGYIIIASIVFFFF